jgi:pimeloyl-ACP methyl ester carboxylesterase
VQLTYDRSGAGPPLVLIHGIGSRRQIWEPVVGHLEPDREVVAIDLPGFGASPRPPRGTPAGIESLTGMVAELLDQLSFERPHVAGNSLGGWVSLELAKRGRVRTATVLSPAGFHNGYEILYQRASLWASYRGARLMSPWAERLLSTPLRRKAALGQFMAHPGRMTPEQATANVRGLAEAPWFTDTLRALSDEQFTGGDRIQVPVTIAWAEHDRVLRPRQAARAVRAIPGARLITLRGCGHVPTYDDPEQVARVLLEGSNGN